MNYRTVALLVAILPLLAACQRGTTDGQTAATGEWLADQTAASPPAVAVEVMEVVPGGMIRSIKASGLIRGVNEATVVSETQGVITNVTFGLGDAVEAGAVLVQVDDRIARLTYRQAQQAYESAQLDLSGVQRRIEAGSASQAELVRAQAAAIGAEASLAQAEKAFRDTQVRATISGRIAGKDRSISTGSYLQRGVPVARIVDLSEIETEVAVGEQELRYLAVGAPASVTVAVCDQPSEAARVASIAAGADRRTGSFPVVIRWENNCGDSVRAGMSVQVSIEPQNVNPQLIVPSIAVRETESEPFIYVVSDGQAVRRTVEIARRLGDRVQIASGVAAGELVIVSGLASLRDGSRIEPTLVGRTADFR